jgi:hypothetical protein
MSQKDTESGETRNERFEITNSATNKDGVVETRGNLLKVKYLGCSCAALEIHLIILRLIL